MLDPCIYTFFKVGQIPDQQTRVQANPVIYPGGKIDEIMNTEAIAQMEDMKD